MTGSLLSNVPLRTTAEWNFFDEIKPLYHAYGRVKVQPIQYTENGQAWFLSEGSIQGIVSLKVDGKVLPVNAYRFSHTTDIDNQPISIVEIGPGDKPADTIEAEILGKIDPVDGTLMNNPAVIIWDFLNNIAGITTARSKLDRLRIECLNAGIEYAGIIGNNSISNRAQFDELLFNTGAIGSVANLDEIASLYPVINIPTERFRNTIDNQLVLSSGSSITSQSIINTLNIEYAYNNAQSKYTRSIKLRSDTEGVFADAEDSIELPFIQNQNAAFSIGRRYLSYRSRPISTFSFDVLESQAPSTNIWVDVNHRYCPVQDAMFVLSSELNLENGTVSLTAERAIGADPEISILSTGTLFEDTTQSVQVKFQDNLVTIIAKDDQGSPLPGARITLDTTTRIADNNGEAVFQASPGIHSLRIEYGGKISFESDNYLISE